MFGDWIWLESEGLGFNLCVVLPRIVVSLTSEDKGQVRDRRSEVGDDFIVKDKSQTRTTRRRFQVVEQEEDLRDLMLREDYVKDKLIFKLKKHTGICPTHIVQSLYKKRTKDFPNPGGIVNI